MSAMGEPTSEKDQQRDGCPTGRSSNYQRSEIETNTAGLGDVTAVGELLEH